MLHPASGRPPVIAPAANPLRVPDHAPALSITTGWETELPAGYTGSILVPADSHSHPQGCSWVLQHEFKSLTRWTHGSFVGVENGTTRMLEWAKLASFVHAPVMPVWAEDAVVKPEGSPTQ